MGGRDAQREEGTETDKGGRHEKRKGREGKGSEREQENEKEKLHTYICTNRDANSSFLPETKNKFYIKVQEC